MYNDYIEEYNNSEEKEVYKIFNLINLKDIVKI